MAEQVISEQHKKILLKYFPEQAVEIVAMWIMKYGILLNITKERATKHGDFTFAPVRGMQKITVNGTLNPYAFLLTFTHEVAHLLVFKQYGKSLLPHGQAWKDTFRTLMLSLPLTQIYPRDILVPLADYLKNPKASSDRHTELCIAFSHYDMYGNKVENGENEMFSVESLTAGDRFFFKENTEYVLGTKRRRLYLCTRVDNGKQYLFQPHALVRKINTDNNE
ncbi:MAG: sprT domain-containing protein [Flavobacteriales bacterium]|nr:sprT domain-containing protein [Flavobacteriales bacterium]